MQMSQDAILQQQVHYMCHISSTYDQNWEHISTHKMCNDLVSS
jgi:hypothetical protein